ncbi:MAG TPA: hypothetical protein VIQ25_06895 [Gemmatimonadales bacterium]
MRVPGWLAAGALLAACHAGPQATPVPMEGTPTDLSALTGTWIGSYRSESTGRHGAVTFRLRAGEDTARGEVEMTFSPALALYGQTRQADDEPPEGEFCRTIDIAIVRVKGNQIRGTLAPYWDPDCDCRTHTVFEGEVRREHIAGRFTSQRETDAAHAVTGEWFADRQPE